jgi:P27 family predicted phage terminase small subunit
MPKGQKPKPALLKKLEGNRAQRGRYRIKEDPPGLGQPSVPVTLTPEERKLHAHVLRSLPPGLLTRADDGILERYASAWADFRDLKAKIQKTGWLVQSPNGPIRNPLCVLLNHARKEMHLTGSDIGLSPAARARLTNVENVIDDPMELLLGMDGDPAGAWSTLPKSRN